MSPRVAFDDLTGAWATMYRYRFPPETYSTWPVTHFASSDARMLC
jgi:hypothetical protein